MKLTSEEGICWTTVWYMPAGTGTVIIPDTDTGKPCPSSPVRMIWPPSVETPFNSTDSPSPPIPSPANAPER